MKSPAVRSRAFGWFAARGRGRGCTRPSCRRDHDACGEHTRYPTGAPALAADDYEGWLAALHDPEDNA